MADTEQQSREELVTLLRSQSKALQGQCDKLSSSALGGVKSIIGVHALLLGELAEQLESPEPVDFSRYDPPAC